MSLGRRPELSERRRRVIYTQRLGEDASAAPTRGGRSKAAEREARRPPTAYASRVRRRIRARWFGLVPVRRASFMALQGGLGLAVALLLGMHALAVGWAPIAYRGELARPLRLDRLDSLGSWFGAMLMASAAGLALLIYLVRRYRTDDYRGRYRLWRPVIVLLALASVDAVVNLVDAAGGLVDALVGPRAPIDGGDWVRLVLCIGGAALGLRLLAEMHRCRFALLFLAAALLALALPTAARWNLLRIHPAEWGLALAGAVLVGRAALWISLVGYLRMLYREVRGLPAEGVAPRAWLAAIRSRRAASDDGAAARSAGGAGPRSKRTAGSAAAVQASAAPSTSAASSSAPSAATPSTAAPAPANQGGASQRSSSAVVGASSASESLTEPARRTPGRGLARLPWRWLAVWRLLAWIPWHWLAFWRPVARLPWRRLAPWRLLARLPWRWLAPWRLLTRRPRGEASAKKAARGQASGSTTEKPRPQVEGGAKPPSAARPSSSPQSAEVQESDSEEEDSIDWSGMSKQERRRLRREMKRDGRAA